MRISIHNKLCCFFILLKPRKSRIWVLCVIIDMKNNNKHTISETFGSAPWNPTLRTRSSPQQTVKLQYRRTGVVPTACVRTQHMASTATDPRRLLLVLLLLLWLFIFEYLFGGDLLYQTTSGLLQTTHWLSNVRLGLSVSDTDRRVTVLCKKVRRGEEVCH